MAASAVLQLTWSIRLRGMTCGPVAIHAMASFIADERDVGRY
jgi:hypothetical protein